MRVGVIRCQSLVQVRTLAVGVLDILEPVQDIAGSLEQHTITVIKAIVFSSRDRE